MRHVAHAQARRRHRRHPDAPDAHGRGPRAAREIRERFPDTGVLVLSQYVEPGYAIDLLAEAPRASATCSKDRVVRPGASSRPPSAGSPRAARRSIRPSSASSSGGARSDDPLDELTPREREVLELMAEGRSNQAIADRLFVTLRAVEKHVTSIFTKLDLPASTDDHRRVLAVLSFFRT